MNTKKLLTHQYITRIFQLALDEDIAYGDCTSEYVLSSNKRIRAEMITKETGVVGGLIFLPLIIRLAKKNGYIKKTDVDLHVSEGSHISKGKVIAVLTGGIKDVLKLERTILNVVSRISGIATSTDMLRQSLGKSRARIYDTRKTIPGWRLIDKYAVTCGGGKNHRMNLGEYLLIKDNHWESDKKGVLSFLRSKKIKKPVELEIDSFDMLSLPEIWNADIIMLDNFTYFETKKAVEIIRKTEKALRKRIEIEVSGSLDKSKIKQLGKLDIDRISIGKITHSAPSLDISLEIIRHEK